MSEQSGQKFDFNVLVFDLWNGKLPLFKVFWYYYVGVVIGLHLLSMILPAIHNLFTLLEIIWAGFMVKPLWLAADQYKGPSHWGLLAKVAVVLIVLGLLGDMLAF